MNWQVRGRVPSSAEEGILTFPQKLIQILYDRPFSYSLLQKCGENTFADSPLHCSPATAVRCIHLGSVCEKQPDNLQLFVHTIRSSTGTRRLNGEVQRCRSQFSQSHIDARATFQ